MSGIYGLSVLVLYLSSPFPLHCPLLCFLQIEFFQRYYYHISLVRMEVGVGPLLDKVRRKEGRTEMERVGVEGCESVVEEYRGRDVDWCLESQYVGVLKCSSKQMSRPSCAVL